MISNIKDCIDKCHDMGLILDIDYVIMLNQLENLYLDSKHLEDIFDQLESYLAEKEDI